MRFIFLKDHHFTTISQDVGGLASAVPSTRMAPHGASSLDKAMGHTAMGQSTPY